MTSYTMIVLVYQGSTAKEDVSNVYLVDSSLISAAWHLNLAYISSANAPRGSERCQEILEDLFSALELEGAEGGAWKNDVKLPQVVDRVHVVRWGRAYSSV